MNWNEYGIMGGDVFCVLLYYFIFIFFIVFFRMIYFSYGEGYIWVWFVDYSCWLSWCFLYKDGLGCSCLCSDVNCNWIIFFKNCRNVVEYFENGWIYFRFWYWFIIGKFVWCECRIIVYFIFNIFWYVFFYYFYFIWWY